MGAIGGEGEGVAGSDEGIGAAPDDAAETLSRTVQEGFVVVVAVFVAAAASMSR